MSRGRVTVIDIAREAGVSKSTVSLVLRDSPLVQAATRERVQQVIEKLGYVYNRSAANLRQSKSKIIGLVVNDLTNSFFAELAVGVDRVMQSASYVQFLANTAESIDRQREVVASMREHGIAGLIISPARGTDANDLRPLAKSGLPVVQMVRDVPGSGVSSIVSDNRGGVAKAVEHLFGLGHRCIAFIGGYADTAVFAERLAGYQLGLEQSGLDFDDKLVFHSSPSRAGGVAALERMLLSGAKPTATVCFNDAVAFGVCDGLRSVKLEPGRDFGVVGFDDVIEAKTAVPALTTISVDPQNMGERAAHLLLKQINSERVEAEAQRLSVRLVVRASCGAPSK
ncbi:LacI family DNA-binding transcriptional regulator [Falsochrobactrum ovis]|uniref:LacI family transcriptional regulator n=1 Tax=Falsochrobactrum ovis TaxID=1293442 RepID=A0A364JYR5_9HYPH|nr:LacI family DNA-binding transcriptional regulator [Falsochrobactrum ovis]RAK33810.1 LacI family transcriptional regulator [Falsochrobactrum ovis]